MVFETRQVWTSPQLPALSPVGVKVLELSRRSETPARELLDCLHSDRGLCDRIVDAANSTWCSTPLPVQNIEQALESLGTTNLTSVTLVLVVREACWKTGLPASQLASFWRQAVVKAVAAETLCEQVQDGLKGEYFLAGLLVDIGRMTLMSTATENYQAVLEKARRELLPLWRAEQGEFGATSARFGAQLVERWGLPQRLVQGIQAQFAPLMTFKQMASTTRDLLASALALASAIGDYLCGEQQALAWFRIRELTAEIVPLSESDLTLLLQRINSRFAAVAPALAVADATLPDLESLKSRAIAQLKTLSSASQATNRTPASEAQPIARRDISADVAADQNQNSRDPLTGVFTADYFREALHEEVLRCCPLALPVGVAFTQIDRLDPLLELHGPSFGDAVLKWVGKLLKDLLRSSDSVGRFEQQFAILACDPTAKGMQRLADRIRGRVAAEPFAWDGKAIPLTVSVGATLALPGRRDEAIDSKVLTAAQRAVKEAADGEGNNVYFDSMVAEIELQRLFMSNQFRFSRWLISKGVLDIPRVGKALIEFKQRPLRLGDLALRQELLQQRDVEEILQDQEESNARFGDVAVRRELLTEDQLVGLLILQQEDPVQVAELFLQKSILDENHLRTLLKEYFSVVPWAAPLYPSADNN